jgi:signal transduction histidine kinase/phage shock protein PspC (stress-responsive transcriptional regulator)
MIAGVAAGIADHLGLPSVAVRAAFVGLLATNGLGALLYVGFWAVLPVASTGGRRVGRVGRVGVLQTLALFALAAGIIMVQVQLGDIGMDPTLVALLSLVLLGAGIIWQPARGAARRRGVDASTAPVNALRWAVEGDGAGGRGWVVGRIVGGGVLVIVGIIGILWLVAPVGRGEVGATLIGLMFSLLALAGLALALLPLFNRVFGQLREERVARIREQERAEVAAVVHDQVLHTLALIQRNSGDAASVLRLARGQERSLRSWLYKPTGSPTERFAAALEEVAAEVEDAFAITVETVVVGDAPNDEPAAAVVAATREALVNAARHAKVNTVSLYAEVEEDALSVFVRDRGAGFDPSTVDTDRQGVRGSIVGRMRRHGGLAEVRSQPGEGTEVRLTMPRGRNPGERMGS